MIFVSGRIPWNPTINLLLKVVTISWLKKLDDLSTLVVSVQLYKGFELNYILEFQNDTSSSSKESETQMKTKIHEELMEEMRKETDLMQLEMKKEND